MNYSPKWDLGTIPPAVFESEYGRRRVAKRKDYSTLRVDHICPVCGKGIPGILWQRHYNPATGKHIKHRNAETARKALGRIRKKSSMGAVRIAREAIFEPA